MAGETVLLIDHNADSRGFLVEGVLKPNGYMPLECDNFDAGARMVADQSPDVVVLAAQTPGAGGPDLLEKLGARGRAIPVILTTTRRSDPWVADVIRAGACDVLVKPFEPDEAARVIQRALAESRMRRERDELTNKLAQTRRHSEWQLQELNALYVIGKAVTATLDLEQVLSQVVEAAANLARAEEGSLMLVDQATGELYLRAAKNIDQRAEHNLRIRVGDSLLGRVIKYGRPVMIAGPDLLKVNTAYLVKALLYIPLKVPPDRIIGVLGVSNRTSERSFTEHDVFVLSALGDYAAVAIENARLFAAMEAERGKLEAVLRGTEDAVLALDRDKRILLCNPAALRALNIETPAVAGLPVSEVIHIQVLLDLFEHPPAVGRPARAEVQLADGRTLQAQISAIESVGYVAVMQDITHLKELDRIKSEFVAVVSHDLRSPLTTVRGYVELLGRVGPLTPQQIEFVNRIERSMKTIADLIGDLLDIGRIEAGLDQEVTSCQLEGIVYQGVDTVLMAAEEKHQTISVDITPGLPPLTGSPRRLVQVVANLLGNAIKYTPEGGEIHVSATAKDQYLMLRVRDNGIGIPLKDQPYIFDRFYRVRSEETEQIVGSGLGLTIVKSVVEKHGGRVWVESAPGQGSVFTVLLPTQQ